MTDDLLAHNGHLAQVLGLHVGHFTHPDRPTGCSVVLCPQGATAGVDVRGAAPGTRETDLLHPSHLVQHVHGITLAGAARGGWMPPVAPPAGWKSTARGWTLA